MMTKIKIATAILIVLTLSILCGIVYFELLDILYVDKVRSEKILDNQGFSNIEIVGYGYNKCPEVYIYATRFNALNPKGKQVEGIVCCPRKRTMFGQENKGCYLAW